MIKLPSPLSFVESPAEQDAVLLDAAQGRIFPYPGSIYLAEPVSDTLSFDC